MERITPKRSAVRKLSTEKFGTNLSASIIRTAFITIEKRPRVMMERGRVRIVRIGLIKKFIPARMMARIRYVT